MSLILAMLFKILSAKGMLYKALAEFSTKCNIFAFVSTTKDLIIRLAHTKPDAGSGSFASAVFDNISEFTKRKIPVGLLIFAHHQTPFTFSNAELSEVYCMCLP